MSGGAVEAVTSFMYSGILQRTCLKVITPDTLKYIAKACAGSHLKNLVAAKNASANTALHWAAVNGYLETFQRLCRARADPFVPNAAGNDVIMEAEKFGRTKVLMWLIDYGNRLKR